MYQRSWIKTQIPETLTSKCQAAYREFKSTLPRVTNLDAATCGFHQARGAHWISLVCPDTLVWPSQVNCW